MLQQKRLRMVFMWWISLFIILCLLMGIHNAFIPRIPKLSKKIYPYAILLGCPCHDDGSLSNSQIKRCELAIREKGKYQTLIITGGAVKNQYYEAIEMKKYIEQKAEIPIMTETKAKNTFANFTNVKKITGDVPILVLTSSLHARRSCAIAKQFYTEYSACTYPHYKIKHIFREIVSRIIYIKIEIQKKLRK